MASEKGGTGVMFAVEKSAQAEHKEQTREVALSRMFRQGEFIADSLIVINIIGAIVLLVAGIATESIGLIAYAIVGSATGILFCISAIALFSIRKEIRALRDVQSEINLRLSQHQVDPLSFHKESTAAEFVKSETSPSPPMPPRRT